MLEAIRAKAYEALRSRAGNNLPPVWIAKGVLTFVNDMMGRPLAPEDEIVERREYETRRRTRIAENTAAVAAEKIASDKADAKVLRDQREIAPVIVYTDAQSHRDLKRISDVFKGRDIPFSEMSVIEDEVTRSWVVSTAKTKEFPVVFVAGTPIGGFDEIVQLDVKGELSRLVFGNA